ncbi:MAG: hypothetical protein KC442_22075 [Thermomicrobiales bacterium]|nr:hypothetical protein [Thermomicrobiales bacterium]
MVTHRWRGLIAAPVAALMLAAPVMAQDSTPTPGSESSRNVDATVCVVEPRTFDDIAAILDLNGAGIPQPPATTITPPLGTVVDADTDAAIKAVAREVLACFNAGDIPRAAALMTESGVKRAYWGLTIDEENRELARTRLAAPAEARAEEVNIRLITITDASTLPDGRVAAFVVLNEPLLPPNGPETLLFIFANEDGTWKVDDYIDFSIVPPSFGSEATPEV